MSERFLLRRAERVARGYSEPQRARVRELHRAARARASVAAGLRSPADVGPAFTLLREALALGVTAALVGAGRHDPGSDVVDPARAFRELGALRGEGRKTPDPGALEPLLSDKDPTVADRLPLSDALRIRPAYEAVLTWLLSLVEVRSVRGIQARRILRVLGVALAFVALLVALVLLALRWA